MTFPPVTSQNRRILALSLAVTLAAAPAHAQTLAIPETFAGAKVVNVPPEEIYSGIPAFVDMVEYESDMVCEDTALFEYHDAAALSQSVSQWLTQEGLQAETLSESDSSVRWIATDGARGAFGDYGSDGFEATTGRFFLCTGPLASALATQGDGGRVRVRGLLPLLAVLGGLLGAGAVGLTNLYNKRQEAKLRESEARWNADLNETPASRNEEHSDIGRGGTGRGGRHG